MNTIKSALIIIVTVFILVQASIFSYRVWDRYYFSDRYDLESLALEYRLMESRYEEMRWELEDAKEALSLAERKMVRLLQRLEQDIWGYE